MLQLFKELYNSFRDLTFGLHSDIPPCCVVYFLKETYGMDAIERSEWSVKEKREIGNPILPFVPCPKCRKDDQYKSYDLHFCKNSDGEFCSLFREQRKEWMEQAIEWRKEKRESNGLQ